MLRGGGPNPVTHDAATRVAVLTREHAAVVGGVADPGSAAKLDLYINDTLYGIKPDRAKPPFRSLQTSSDGVRMTMYYYNQSHFAYNYTEAAECGVVGGLNYNWCMTERYANATYRGFNVRPSA